MAVWGRLRSARRSGSLPPARAQVVSALTVGLPQTYQRCSPSFRWSQVIPRRVLTKPSEGVENSGYDNVNSDLVVCVHDVLVSSTGTRWVAGRGAARPGGRSARGGARDGQKHFQGRAMRAEMSSGRKGSASCLHRAAVAPRRP